MVQIYWSPAGHHVVLAGTKNLNGVLNFFNAGKKNYICASSYVHNAEKEGIILGVGFAALDVCRCDLLLCERYTSTRVV